MKFFSNPVQQDANLIFTVQERNIFIVINLIYEMNNLIKNKKKAQLKKEKRKTSLEIYIENKERKYQKKKINENIEIKMS